MTPLLGHAPKHGFFFLSAGVDSEVRVPGDYPEKAVRVSKVAGVATPRGFLPGLHERAARSDGLLEGAINDFR